MSVLSLSASQTLAAHALSYARSHGLKPMSIVILDARGALVAAASEDGCALGRWKVALGKASGALFLGVGSRRLGVMASERPHFIAGATHLAPDGMVPVPGGVLICDGDGAILGAAGASGDTSENDEAAAAAGIAAVGLKAEAG